MCTYGYLFRQDAMVIKVLNMQRHKG